MALFISLSITLSLLLLSGCSTNKAEPSNDNSENAQKEIKDFKEQTQQKMRGSIPALILPNPYKEVSVFGEDKITLSTRDAKLGVLLNTIADTSGLNLIIDKDIDTDMPISISVNKTDIKDVLNIIMDISGSYYQLNGNILHIKQFMRKNFSIPYTHSITSFKTELGGDILNSAQSGGGSSSSGGGGGSGQQGIKGDFSLKYDNPDKVNGFYENLENSVKTLLSKEGSYTLNRFSGVLSVYDRKKNLDAIETLVEEIKSHAHKQVLIEAKILEVNLNKDHSLGVSWEAVVDNIIKTGDNLILQQPLALTGAVAGTMTYTTKNFSTIMNALDQSGDVDTLSNPRIKVLSGQSAIISSGKLVPFWEKEVQTLQGTGGSASNQQVTYNRRDVLNGLTMGVTPTILDNGKIMLNVIPITSNIEDVIDYTDENGKVVASAPVLNIKEAGTIIYAKDNDLVLIGGLINNVKSKQLDSIPLLGDIPYLGALFRNEITKNEKRELVILIKLRVIQ
jgi:MSHA biogenesis protein MshL